MADSQWRLVGTKRLSDDHINITQFREIDDAAAKEVETAAKLIDRLARQPEFRRTIDCAARLDKTLELVEQSTPPRSGVPDGLRRMCELDVVAVARAGNQCCDGLLAGAQKLNAVLPKPPVLNVLAAARDHVLARTEYLVLQSLEADAIAQGLVLQVVGGSVVIEARGTYDPRILSRALVGYLFYVVAAFLDTFNAPLSKASDAISGLASEVNDGEPQLLRIHPSMKMDVIRLPTVEIAALRAFREAAIASHDQSATIRAAMQLMASVPKHDFSVGGVDLSAALIRATATDSMDALATAGLELDPSLLGSTVIDYWAPVTYTGRHGASGRKLFTGAVQRADPGPATISIKCESAADLTEHNPWGIAIANVSGDELVRSVIAQSGLPEDEIYLDGEAPMQPEEAFEVFAPIRGLAVKKRLAFAGVSLVPVRQAKTRLRHFDASTEAVRQLIAGFRDATCYALTSVIATSLHDAEEAGWTSIQTAIAWITANQRSGFVRSVDGQPSAFSREAALRPAELVPLVLVRGRKTKRQWLRRRTGAGRGIRILSLESDALLQALPVELTPPERRSLLAIRRAITETTLESQLQAIWEALESYAAGERPRKLFSRAEIDRIRAAMPTDLTAEQMDKLGSAVGGLNNPPLSARLRWRMAREAVPLADHESELIFTRLRDARNDLAHGRVIKNPPTRGDILLGVSVTARIVLCGIFERTRKDGRSSSDVGAGDL